MTNDSFQDIQTPTLTLEPFAEEQPAEALSSASTQPAAPLSDESALSPEERRMVDEFAAKISLSDSNLVLQYGSGAQKKIADFSENTLNSVRTKDLGQIGEMLTGVVTELRGFETVENEKGFLGLFKKSSNKMSTLRAKYAKAEANIDHICTALESHQIQLLKDVAMLDKMYELNKVYFKELSMYILAGKKKLRQVEETELGRL